MFATLCVFFALGTSLLIFGSILATAFGAPAGIIGIIALVGLIVMVVCTLIYFAVFKWSKSARAKDAIKCREIVEAENRKYSQYLRQFDNIKEVKILSSVSKIDKITANSYFGTGSGTIRQSTYYTFSITYNNGSTTVIEAKQGSFEYDKLITYVK